MLTWIKRYRYTILALILLMLLPLAVVFIKGYFTLRDFDIGAPLQAAAIFDRDGKLIGTLGENGRYVTIDAIPKDLANAVVAVEDSRFYKHAGVDLIGIARALFTNLREGDTVQGGSTITQQVAKNLFLHPRKTLARKLEELALAVLLEARYSKEQILELYLNSSYFGEGAYGVESAARTYFGKTVSELSLGESSLLAGLLQAPSAYSPYKHLEKALNRRAIVLERMVVVGYLEQDEAERAKSTAVKLAELTGGTARYFLDWVSQLLIHEYGEAAVFGSGLRVHTSLDLEMQKIAEEIFSSQDQQGALVALNPRDGTVLALVGGRNYIESQFNRAVNARRQPGSVFKPIIYAAAIKQGWQVNTIVEDIPREYSGYKPDNHGEAYWGPVTMKHAIALSLNNAAVWTLNEIGISTVFDFAKAVGIELPPQDRNLALALGGLTDGVTPLEMTAAFVPFANGGAFFTPNPIVRIVDQSGRVLQDNRPEKKQVLSPQQAYLMSDMLQAVMDYGTGSVVPIERPSAGKSGTTNNQRDLWFVGFTPDIVVGVFIGNDDNSPVAGYGGSIAGPIWAEFINRSLADKPPRDFPVPSLIVTDVMIDVFTGLLATERCEWTELDAFIEGTVPTERAPCAIDWSQRQTRQVPIPEPPSIPEPEPEREQQPEEPEVPETPAEPEQPAEPLEPEVPEIPEEPEAPAQPQPEVPIEPEPEQPIQPVEPEAPEPPPTQPQMPEVPQPEPLQPQDPNQI